MAKRVYSFVGATDTNNVQFVLDACLDMIIAKNLKSMGLC